jgi:hypothetical protein
MKKDRSCVLFFHGGDGLAHPRPMGGLSAETLLEALEIMKAEPRMPAHVELAGIWCCSFADKGEAGLEHPASCQYRFTLSAKGRISGSALVQ